MKVKNAPHRFTDLLLRELRVEHKPYERVIEIHLAYLNERGETCGRLTVSERNLRPETLNHFNKLQEMIEKDAAQLIFEIDEESENEEVLEPY